jgi:RimJ/RimL family protein N-acetyltransferase
MPTLSTERLFLRPFEESDLDDLCALYGDAEVRRYLSSGVLGRADTADRLRRMMDHWQAHGYGMWAVFLKEDATFLGRCGVAYMHDCDAPELAYTFVRKSWGHGYATEAARAAVDYAFKQTNLPRIVGLVVAENLASRNVMRKLGMKFECVAPCGGHEAMRHVLDNPYMTP